MKYLILTVAILMSLVSSSALMVSSAGAIDVAPQCSDPKFVDTNVCKEIQSQSGTTQSPIVRLIGVIISVLSYVIGAAAIIGIIVSSLRMILANGDSGGIASARSSIIYCLIGLAIAAIAQSIVIFVLNKL
jgi:hypothetical protein